MPKEFQHLIKRLNLEAHYSPNPILWSCVGFRGRIPFRSRGNYFSIWGLFQPNPMGASEVANTNLEDYNYLKQIFDDILFIRIQGKKSFLIDSRCAFAINGYVSDEDEAFDKAYNIYMKRIREEQKDKEWQLLGDLKKIESVKNATFDEFVIETENNIFMIPTHIALLKRDMIIQLLNTKYLSKSKEKLAFIGKLGVLR